MAGKFSVFTLNCQSINAKFDNLYIVLNDLCTKDTSKFSVINIQESWLKWGKEEKLRDVSMYQLPGYQTFALGAS